MTEDPAKPHLTSVMSGQGFYNRHSRTQALALTHAFPFLDQAAELVPLPETGGTFHIADLGSSQGRNSQEPIKRILRTLRRRGMDFPLAVTHNDQAGNDFATLFTLLQQDPDSYLREFPDVFSYAIGRSFYEPLFPTGSVDLIWSSIAVHWMSRIPIPLQNHVWPGVVTSPESSAFASQAQEDWERFLLLRARELKPEGSMVLIACGSDARGLNGGEPFIACLDQVLREATSQGRLKAVEYETFTVPIYSRTLEEYLAPFAKEPYRSLYRVVASRLDAAPDAQCLQYQQSGDAKKFADDLTGFLRAFTEPLLRSALDQRRSSSEVEAISQAIYQNFRNRVLEDPEAMQFFWNACSLHLVRTDRSA